MNEKAILNGILIEDNKINIDTGFYFGLGVFETILVEEGIPVFFEEHLERLRKSLILLNIDFTYTNDEIYQLCLKLLNQKCALKLSVSEKNFLITTRNFDYPDALYERGFSLIESSVLRNSTSPFSRIKSFHYGDSIMEKNAAIQKGYDDALFFNENGFLAETTMCNLFFGKGNTLFTPHRDCGILPGIVRNWILQNFEVKEGYYTKEDVTDADFVFITNSLMGIMPISKIGMQIFPTKDIFEKYHRQYSNFLKEKKRLLP